MIEKGEGKEAKRKIEKGEKRREGGRKNGGEGKRGERKRLRKKEKGKEEEGQRGYKKEERERVEWKSRQRE